MATGSRTDVWKYVNPDLPTEPAIPILEDPPNADDYATLSATAKETFKFLYQLWKDRMIQVSKTREVLELIQIHITKTVSTSRFDILFRNSFINSYFFIYSAFPGGVCKT